MINIRKFLFFHLIITISFLKVFSTLIVALFLPVSLYFFFNSIKLTLSSGDYLIVVLVLGFQDESGKTQQARTPNTIQYS